MNKVIQLTNLNTKRRISFPLINIQAIEEIFEYDAFKGNDLLYTKIHLPNNAVNVQENYNDVVKEYES